MGTGEVRWGVGSKALTLTYVFDTNSYFTSSFIGTKRNMNGGCWGVENKSDSMAGEERNNWKMLRIGDAKFVFSLQSTTESEN